MKKFTIFILLIIFCFNTNANAIINNGLIDGARNNNINQVKAYIHPRIVNTFDLYGNTALTYALRNQNYNIINMLLYNGADPTIKDSSGNYIFCSAFASSDPNIRYLFSRFNQKVCSVTATPRSKAVSSEGFSPSVSMTTLGVIGGVALVGGGVALAVGGGGGDSGNNENGGENNNVGDLSNYLLVGGVSDQKLDNILNSTEYSKNEEENGDIRLAYSLARGYTGKINSSNDEPAFAVSNSHTNTTDVDQYIKIAIIDSGVRVTHDDLDDNIIETTYGHTNLAAYYCSDTSFCDNEGALNDPTPGSSDPIAYHGTMVAGYAAAEDNNMGVIGVAPDAQILPFRATLDDGSFVPDFYLGEAFKTARKEGVTVVNNSYGTDATASLNAAFLYGESLLNMPIADAQYKLQLLFSGMAIGDVIIRQSNFISEMINGAEAGMVFVFAASNDNYIQPSIQNGLPLYFPELQGNFITVVNYNSSADALSSLSNRCGVAKDYCLTAPGTSIDSTHSASDTAISTGTGTSYAAPIVSGAVAVLKGAFPYLTGDEITSLLFETARDLGEPGVDEIYGNGMLDLERATRPVGAQLVPIDTRVSGENHDITTTSLKLTSGIANSIKKENLNLIMLDSYNRSFSIELNNFIDAEFDMVDIKETLRNFGNKASKKINIGQNGLLNFHYTASQNNSDNMQPHEAQLIYDDDKYGFSMYLGNNPYNGFVAHKTISYHNYTLAEAYNRNALNPYFTTNSEDNFGINTYIALNDKTKFNFGFLYQNYAMELDESSQSYNPENIGSGFAVISGLSYDMNNNLATSIELGFISEKDTLLGTAWDGALGLGDYTSTYMLSMQIDAKFFDEKLSLIGKYNLGYTTANTSSDSLILDIDNISSQSFALGVTYDISIDQNKEQSIAFLVSQPVQIKSGNLNLALPIARDFDGNIYYDHHLIDLETTPETIYQLTYNHQLNETSSFNIGAMYRDYVKDEFLLMVKFTTFLND